jgi:ATPase subunit of ABC transporter with duplicated ATPase domains
VLVSHDRALLDAVAERTLAIEDEGLRSYHGGWAEYVRRRGERTERDERDAREASPREPAQPKHVRRRTATPTKPRPTELQLVEAQIAAGEETVAALERRLADDWSDVQTLAEHRRARDELESLLARWEELFEQT